jgi:LysM repeat protein
MWAVSLLLLVYPARAQAQAGGGGTHVVAAGETLSQIARNYGVDVATLLELNGLSNANLVYVGQQLVVSGGGWEEPRGEQPRWQEEEVASSPQGYNRQGVGWEPQQSGQPYQRAGVGWQPQGSPGGPTRPGVAWEPQNSQGDSYQDDYQEEVEWESAPAQRSPYLEEWESVHSERGSNPPGSSWEPRQSAEVGRGEELSGEKWIDIDIGDQVLTAYQGDTAVRFFIISSGSARYPTVTGSFRTYARTELQDMSGGSQAAGDYYFQADVPWVQYFFEDYAIHGAYWHNSFGTPIGHGCINMRVDDSRWLYEWTGVAGIRVEVHQ